MSRKIFTVKLKLFHHHTHVRFNYCAHIMFYEQDPPTCRALQRIGHPPAHPPHVTPTKHKQKIRHLSINRARPRGHKTQTNSLLISVLSFCYIYIYSLSVSDIEIKSELLVLMHGGLVKFTIRK